MFKENKGIIIILCIIFIVITVAVFFVNDYYKNIDEKQSENPILQNDTTIKIVEDKDLLLTCKQIIDGYLINMSNKLYNQVYLLYTDNYINYNNLTVEDIEKINLSFNGNYNYHIISMHYSEGNSVTTVYSYGTLYGDNQPINSYFKILLDYSNNSYALEPIDEKQFNEYISYKGKVNEEHVSANDYNKFQKSTVNEPSMCAFYFSDYKYNITYDLETVYNNFSSWFIEEQFKDFSILKNYIENNYNDINLSYLKEYQVYYTDNRTNYVCVASNNLVYEFYVYDLFKYKMSFSSRQ